MLGKDAIILDITEAKKLLGALKMLNFFERKTLQRLQKAGYLDAIENLQQEVRRLEAEA